MARLARVVAPGYPHHLIQRGNRKQKVFFRKNDYLEYLNLLKTYSSKSDLTILSYCLMPNHVHLIVIPKTPESLARAIGEVHRRYTRMINFRENWRGYLWQGRFSSYVLDEKHLLAATRYILRNPVEAKIVNSAWGYEWSSAKQHLRKREAFLIKDDLLKSLIGDWKAFLQSSLSKEDIGTLKRHETTGRPLGSLDFIKKLEKTLNRSFKRKKPGPKKNN